VNKIFKKYNLKLLTLGPVHIGDGHTYTKKEFIYENNAFYFPDMGKLYQYIENKGPKYTENFENYLLKSDKSADRLVNLLNSLRISERTFGGYSIKRTGFESESVGNDRRGNVTNIDSFIKNAFYEPYIPGSSLKGALRTILCNEHFKTDDIPWGARNKVAFDDVFHNIRISDSKPFAIDDLILSQKIDYSTRKAQINAINVYRESIKPRTVINFTITCEGDQAIQLMEQLEKVAKNYYKHYMEYFLGELQEEYRQDFNLGKIVYLGAGSGFWTKTIIDQADPKRFQQSKGKIKMVGKGVHKLTKAAPTVITTKNRNINLMSAEGYYEMGKCYFELKELSSI